MAKRLLADGFSGTASNIQSYQKVVTTKKAGGSCVSMVLIGIVHEFV